MLLHHQRMKLIGLAIVILFCYSLSAIFQEKVLRRPYGDGEGERFTFAFAFTAVQCIIYASVAKAVITVRGHPKNETPQRFFCIIGVFYVLGKVTSYMSLRYVPYPTQVVGKSAKPIPIMILGVLIGRKTYTAYKYIFVFIIVVGVALFSFKEKYDKKDGEDPILGIIFIGVSLLMDGFLGAFEDRMRSVKKPTPLNFMLFMNSWNSLYLIVYLLTTTEGIEFFKFCQRHPDVIPDLGVVVFFGIFGQFCITSMVANFGALPLSITTTIRKFVTVLLSVVIFNNVLSIRQWIAASIIFSALFLDGYFSKKGGKNNKAKVNNELEAGPAEESTKENGGNDNSIRKSSLSQKTETSPTEGRSQKRVRISISEDDLPTEDKIKETNESEEKIETENLQNPAKVDEPKKSIKDLEGSLQDSSEQSVTEKLSEKTDDTKL